MLRFVVARVPHTGLYSGHVSTSGSALTARLSSAELSTSTATATSTTTTATVATVNAGWSSWSTSATPAPLLASTLGFVQRRSLSVFSGLAAGGSESDDGDSPKPGSGSKSSGGKSDDEGPSTTLDFGDKLMRRGSTQFIIKAIETPENVVVVPLHRRPIFPSFYQMIHVADEQYIKVIEDVVRGTQEKLVAAVFLNDVKDGEVRRPSEVTPDSLHGIGCVAKIVGWTPHEAGGMTATLYGIDRIRLDKVTVATSPERHLKAKYEVIKVPKYEKDGTVLVQREQMLKALRSLYDSSAMFNANVKSFIDSVDVQADSDIADFGVAMTNASATMLQRMLETVPVPERMELATRIMERELETAIVHGQIKKSLDEKVEQNHKRYILMEQLKILKKELGLERDDKSVLVNKFRERIGEESGLTMPEDVAKVVEDELNKLSTLEPSSSEFNVTRNYLEWLTTLPWGIEAEENLDLHHAETVLNEDHHGLTDVKERILEFIAVGALKGSVQGKILCFAGPPGVGKTSIGKSIARALDRPFFRFSVGGMTDVAEIKGHRRTYIGAMPGKFIQCMKKVGASNPVIMIDEIDKLGRGYQGDPAAALLEALDPEQNSGYLDHYLDVPFDLSKVLFVCTANVTDSIPGPLLDRMEVLRLSGYILDEKVAIVKNHLLNDAYEGTGLRRKDAVMQDSAIKELIKSYCREAGVRSLQKHIERVFRKIALRVAKAQSAAAAAAAAEADGSASGEAEGELTLPVRVTKANLSEFVGQPKYPEEALYSKRTPVGVVTGLAWTALGGSVLYIETACDALDVTRKEDRASLSPTGQIGDVMRESTDIAYSVAKHFVQSVDKGSTFFQRANIHLHVPEGAVPKDGPSAGVTMVTALLSLALNKRVTPGVAMTGELSLTGKVLAIGGVKEKCLAAARAGVKHIVLPEANRKDFEELDESVRAPFTVHYAKTYKDVYEVAFGDATTKTAEERSSEASSDDD